MLRTTLALGFGVIYVLPAVALAGPCEDKGITGKYLKLCYDRVQRCDRARGRNKVSCLDRAIDGTFRDQQRREARAAQKNAEAGEWKACNDEAYAKACYALRELRVNVCDPAHKQPRFVVATNEPLDKSVARLTARYRAYAEGIKNMAAFVKSYGKCDQAPPRYRPNCTFDKSYQEACTAAEGRFKAAWASYIESFATRELPGMLKAIQKLKRSKKAPTFMNNYHVDAPLQIVEELIRVNRAYPWIAVPAARLAGIEKKVRANHREMRRTIEKMIANVRCPVSETSGPYFTIASTHLQATKDAGSTMQEQVKRLGITGAAVTKVNPFLRITHEDLPGQMCVEQVKDGTKACRVFRMNFRRSKPFGGSWSAWHFYSIAGGELMSCKNLK